MSIIYALTRASWLTYASYRLNVVFSLGGMLVMLLPLKLISTAIQPIAADSISTEGADYFAFVVIGIATMQLVSASVRGLPQAITGAIGSGTLEALLATPASFFSLMFGLQSFGLLWAAIRSLVLVAALVPLGGDIRIAGLPLALAAVALLIAVHLAFAMLIAAAALVFRSIGPLVTATTAAVSLLGGVYYSADVIPAVLRPLSSVNPLTYGLRAVRRALLTDLGTAPILADLAVVLGFTAILGLLGSVVLRWSVNWSKRQGSLAQY